MGSTFVNSDQKIECMLKIISEQVKKLQNYQQNH
jgi:hypothetical protein